MRNKHAGSRLEDFLREEGIYEEVKAAAIKKVLAMQMLERMHERRMSKAALAARMHTSRAAVDRLLDPSNESVTLHTICGAASALGAFLKVELVREQRKKSATK